MGSAKIYLATSGSYSDYRVHHAFATEKLAEAYASKVSEGEVKEFELRDQPVERRAWYQLTWWPDIEDRRASSMATANPSIWDYVEDYNPDRKLNHQWLEHHMPGRPSTLRVEGWDRVAVMKVYSEQRARYLAEKEGIA